MAEDLFDGLSEESEEEIRRITAERNPIMEELLKNFEKTLETKYYGDHSDRIYEPILDNLPNFANEITPSDIRQLFVRLKDYEDYLLFNRKSGLYLSALINCNKDEHFKISTNHFGILISKLGYKNTKHIEIYGDVGESTGSYMENGTLIINGNVGDFLGYRMNDSKIEVNGDAKSEVGNAMQNGLIMIKNNAGDCVGNGMEDGKITIGGDVGFNAGCRMKSGRIIINGNAGDWVGVGMNNGTIYLNRDYSSISQGIKCGNIYHKGKLIVKDGNLV